MQVGRRGLGGARKEKHLRPVRQAELHDPARRPRGRPRKAVGRQERLGGHGGALSYVMIGGQVRKKVKMISVLIRLKISILSITKYKGKC